jgi:hypothetical protein
MIMRWYKSLYEEINSSFHVEGGAWTFTDEGVSVRDTYRFLDAYRYWVAAYVDAIQDLPGFTPPGVAAILKLLDVWHLLYWGYPLDEFFKLLKALVLLVRREATLTEYRSLLLEYPELGERMVPILVPLLLNRQDPSRFFHLHGFLNFLSKFGMERKTLEVAGLKEWFLHEDHLNRLDEIQWEVQYSEESLAMRRIICSWLSLWTPDLIERGYYTTGSTADAGRDISRKLQLLDIPIQLGSLVLSQRSDLLALSPANVRVGYQFCSKWTQVPKSSLSLREISMEPAACNFWQSALDDSIRRAIRKSPLHRIYDPEDQARSRKLAVYGSATGLVATLDHSKASDSVRLSHVKAWFPEGLLDWLLATRSPICKVGDSTVLLAKFAPMGSRLTFDVESIIFAAMAWVATVCSGGDTALIRIFGDDVIIDTRAVPKYQELCSMFGFILNMDKSYDSGGFREACGVFAYKGVDVTYPQMPRRMFAPMGETDSNTVQWLSVFCNRCYYLGMPILRYVLLSDVRRFGNPLFRYPSDEDRSSTLFGWATVEAEERGCFCLVSDAPTQWRTRKSRVPNRPLRKGRDRASGNPPMLPDYGWGRGLHLTPQYEEDRRDDTDAYAVWLYYASYRIDADRCDCDDSLIDCRTVRKLARSPANRWYTYRG